MANNKQVWGQSIVDSLNWNVLREYYEDKNETEEFKSMSKNQVEQWFLGRENKRRMEQGLELITIEEIRELLKKPYKIKT